MGRYNNDRSGRGSRNEMHSAVCDKCGKDCEVPFKPSGDKPIFCSECFEKKNSGGRGRGNDRSSDRGSRGNYRGRNDRERRMYSAVCDSCGERCEVPFKPTSGKPIYCSSCFDKDSKPSSSTNVDAKLEEINEKLDLILKTLKPIVPEKDADGEVSFRDKKVVRLVKDEKLRL